MKKRDLAFIKHLPCIRPRISSKPQKRPCEKRTIRPELGVRKRRFGLWTPLDESHIVVNGTGSAARREFPASSAFGRMEREGEGERRKRNKEGGSQKGSQTRALAEGGVCLKLDPRVSLESRARMDGRRENPIMRALRAIQAHPHQVLPVSQRRELRLQELPLEKSAKGDVLVWMV